MAEKSPSVERAMVEAEKNHFLQIPRKSFISFGTMRNLERKREITSSRTLSHSVLSNRRDLRLSAARESE